MRLLDAQTAVDGIAVTVILLYTLNTEKAYLEL